VAQPIGPSPRLIHRTGSRPQKSLDDLAPHDEQGITHDGFLIQLLRDNWPIAVPDELAEKRIVPFEREHVCATRRATTLLNGSGSNSSAGLRFVASPDAWLPQRSVRRKRAVLATTRTRHVGVRVASQRMRDRNAEARSGAIFHVWRILCPRRRKTPRGGSRG